LAINELLCLKNAGAQISFFLHQMNNRQPWQLKKSKTCGPFWNYQLDINANLAHLPQKWAKWAEWAVCLAGSSKTTPRILICSIAMGRCQTFILAEIFFYLSTLKS
jgi:hypothetical protein